MTQGNSAAAKKPAGQRPRWIEKWDSFWFKPQSPLPMAVFRILFSLVLLENLLVHIWPDFDIYYSQNNLIPIQDMIARYWHNDHMFDALLLFPNQDQYIYGTFYVLVGATVCLSMGLFTRLSAWLVFLLLMSFGNHFELNQNAGDNYMRLAAMCLAFSNCGDALSIDSLIKCMRQDWRVTGFYPIYSAPWAQRLLQLQLMIAYAHTWICKIEGFRWNEGTATYFATRYDDVMRFPLPHFVDQLWFYQATTWGTLLIEFVLWNLIWWKPARYWVMLSGLMLHLGIEYCMNLPMFEWNFMFTYILFIDPADFSRWFDQLKAKITKQWGQAKLLAFDGQSISAVRFAGLKHRLDPFGRLKLVEVGQDGVKELLGNRDTRGKVLLQGSDGNWQVLASYSDSEEKTAPLGASA